MELIENNEKNNSISGKIRGFDRMLNFILTLTIVPLLAVVGIGFKTTNITLMAVGCALLALPIIANYYREKLTENLIVRYAVERAAESLKILNRSYLDGEVSLDEYLEKLKGVIIPDLEEAAPNHLAVARVLSRNDYSSALLEAAQNVAGNEDVKKYFVLEEALTKDIIKISPTTYYDETNKYLSAQRRALDVEPHFNKLLTAQRKKFVADNKSLINQMNYNLRELYKIKEGRNEQAYKKNFEEMMSSSWIPGNK